MTEEDEKQLEELKGGTHKWQTGSLVINNLDLIDVNPCAEELTLAQKTAVIDECRENPEYFYQKVVRFTTNDI